MTGAEQVDCVELGKIHDMSRMVSEEGRMGWMDGWMEVEGMEKERDG